MLQKLMNIIFHPILWSTPFIGLMIFGIFQIFTKGVFDAKLPIYKPLNCINVVMFCFLWLWSIYSLPKKGINNLLVVYLSFCLIFACYGVGELFYRFVWTPRNLARRDLFVWTFSFIYPVFFAYNNVPLFIFLKKEIKEKWRDFMLLISTAFGCYCLFYIFETHWLVTSYFPIKGWSWYAEQVAYYFARLTSVFAYGFLLLDITQVKEDIGFVRSFIYAYIEGWYLYFTASTIPSTKVWLPFCKLINRRMICWFCPYYIKEEDKRFIRSHCKIAYNKKRSV